MASPFVKVATGGRREIDAGEVRRALAALVDRGHGVFLQTLPTARWVCPPGDDLDTLVKEVKELSYGKGTYFALNPCPVGQMVTAKNVIARRWVLFDFDPVREKDTNSTEQEHDAARECAAKAMDFLSERGWPLPLGIDSGNGWHLLYRVELPNDRLAHQLVRDVLRLVAGEFDTEAVKLGVECCDSRRISKLPGTMTRKGPHSDERPQRWARLVYHPDPVEVVPAALLQELADEQRNKGGPAKTPPRPARHDPFHARAGDRRSLRAYGKEALRREAARVVMAPRCRNNTINDACFRVGTLVPSGALAKQEVIAEMELAASMNGVLKDEPEKTRDTIRRAVEAGMENPRVVPERNGVHPPVAGGGKSAGKENQATPLTVCAAAVTPKPVSWLWPLRVPKKFVTVFAGRTSIGKSFVTCDLIARLSRGGEIPFGQGECFERGGTLFISEDPHDYMLTPRLIEMGADLSMVQFMTWDAMAKYSLTDTDMLGQAFGEVSDPKLVVIDPPTNFLGDADEHRNSEVRQILMRLVAWVLTTDAALILIMHVNKQTGKGIEAIYRVMGSVAWVTTSRIAHSFTPDPDDQERVLFLPMKTNLGAKGNGLAYRIVKTDALAKVEWLGEVEITADEAMNNMPHKPRRVVASEWLIEQFREKLSWPSSELFAAARAANISRNAVFEAKATLDLPRAKKVIHENGTEEWFWWVPADWPRLSLNDESPPTLEIQSDDPGFSAPQAPGTGTVGTVGTVDQDCREF